MFVSVLGGKLVVCEFPSYFFFARERQKDGGGGCMQNIMQVHTGGGGDSVCVCVWNPLIYLKHAEQRVGKRGWNRV